MGKIPNSKLESVKALYYGKKMSMKEIAGKLGVSIDAVVYFMRKHGLYRRTFSEMNKVRFENKKPSFEIRKNNSLRARELKAIGAMLYWGEGYKGDKSSGVDFANSDPEMIRMFLVFLRSIYKINEKKLRILLYCYSNQNTAELIKFWSKLTNIPKEQFTKPYARKDFNERNNRKMQYGLIHVRYSDKKLLLSLKDLINSYKVKHGCVA